MRTFTPLLLLAGACLLGCPGAADAVDTSLWPIDYRNAFADNSVAALTRDRRGVAALAYDDDRGYLPALLARLDVPASSQVLVFSKTSFQRSRIGPAAPRAIYFNDEITVGYCLGGDVLELAVADPVLGTAFYTVDQDREAKAPVIRQTDDCLNCHASSATREAPGHLNRSLFADRTGVPLLARGSTRVDHSTPLADRWGGWYVTGTSGRQGHRGNRVFDGDADETGATGQPNVADLRRFFPVASHLRPHSDLVALMVLAHQGEAHNRLVQTSFLTQRALAEQEVLNKALNRPADERSEGITGRIERACEPLVQYMLFCDEAPLAEAVAGTSAFAREFAARGPFDGKRRTLREFDLRTRTFRYPLSYLIYSRTFDRLPDEAKARVYRRLWDVLTGRDQSKEFAHLSPADRRGVLEIVRETKKGLPAYWAGDTPP